jgi:hypothetical protein
VNKNKNIWKAFVSLSEGYNFSLALLTVWGGLYFIPWIQWLDFMPWLRMGLGMCLFIFPGMVASLFLIKDRFFLLSHAVSGFVLSIFFVGVLGLLGRIVHVSFANIKTAFLLLGLVLILAVMAYQYYFPQKEFYLWEGMDLKTTLVLISLMIFGIMINFLSRTTGDDQSYLAYLTTWGNSPALSFSEVYFGLGTVDSKRFWLAVFPMSLSLIESYSNIHGLLLIGFYLEPFMICLAVLAAYLLYKTFLESNVLSMSALLLQITFFFFLRDYQQVGTTFFNRLSEDKSVAAFILMPVFLWAAHHLIERLTWQRGVFLLLCGWSLTLTHPVILAYSAFIAAGYASLTLILQKQNYVRLAVIIFLIVIIVAPGAVLRFVDDSASQIPYDLDQALEGDGGIETRIDFISGTPFYGFPLERIQISTLNFPENKNVLQFIFSWSYVWMLGLVFLWSLLYIRQNVSAPLLLTSSLLVLLALIPYTGWLLGYFVSARMLWRVPWVFPIGLGFLLLLQEVYNLIVNKVKIDKLRVKNIQEKTLLFSSLCIFVCSVGYFAAFAYKSEWKNLSRLEEYRMGLERLVSLGDYLEKNIEKPARFITPDKLLYPIYGLFSQNIMDYLPGLSSKAKVVYFRFWESSMTVDRVETDLLFTIDGTVNFQQKKNIMYKYKIEYIIVDDPELKKHFASRPELFHIEKAAGFWIIGLR